MKRPKRFTVETKSPSGDLSLDETTFLNTTYLDFLKGKGYEVNVWEDARFKARERLYRIKLKRSNPERYEKEFGGVYRNHQGAILTF